MKNGLNGQTQFHFVETHAAMIVFIDCTQSSIQISDDNANKCILTSTQRWLE